MSKVTSLCQTFNQSLYNTIYLRFSFEYLFENFIIVSLHMCISYIFFILFYFSYSYRQIVYYFFVALFAMFVLLSVVKNYHLIPECTQNLWNLHIPCFNLKKGNFSEYAGVWNRAHCHIFFEFYLEPSFCILLLYNSCFRDNNGLISAWNGHTAFQCWPKLDRLYSAIYARWDF